MSVSCEDTDKLNFDPLALPSGAFLRTLNVDSANFNLKDLANSNWAITVEGDDGSNGSLMTSVDLHVTFKDNTPENGTVSLSEALVRNFPISAFTRGASGLLGGSISATANETFSALGLDSEDVDGGDSFTFRLTLHLSDGRSFSSTEIGPDVTGAFFNSPFRYVAAVVCIPTSAITGEWTLDLVDNYGDGWQGSQVVMNVDGVETAYFVPDFWGTTNIGGNPQDPEYFRTVHVVTVPATAGLTPTFTYVAGDFPSECEFKIFAPSGNLVGEGGPSPAPGDIVLNLCRE